MIVHSTWGASRLAQHPGLGGAWLGVVVGLVCDSGDAEAAQGSSQNGGENVGNSACRGAAVAWIRCRPLQRPVLFPKHTAQGWPMRGPKLWDLLSDFEWGPSESAASTRETWKH
jgi:hypothetical protein